MTGLDAELPIYKVETMDELLTDSMSERQLQTFLLVSFALLALTLAGIGIYGVMSYGVAQRRHEIGVRIALGAQRGEVARMILSRALLLTLAGLALGLIGTYVFGRYLETLLFETKPADPATLVSVTLVLAGVALLAAAFPAARATKVDPMVVLRYD